MFYDLNVPWTSNQAELQRVLAFLSEFGYNVVALDHTSAGKLPAELTCPIPNTLLIPTPPALHILRRCTLVLADPSQNHRLAALASTYDILAIRPTNERTLLQACQSIECDLISLDLSTRFPFYFKHKTCSLALQRGLKFEICYGPGILASDGGASRRNLISNATQLIRATRGRGIIISSEAKRALACRGPSDVVNLAVLWGLGQERGVEAIGREARSVIVQAEMRRRSFKGVIDVVYGGEKPEQITVKGNKDSNGNMGKGKRKADVLEQGIKEDTVEKRPVSKREKKRQVKKAKFGSNDVQDGSVSGALSEIPAQQAPPIISTPKPLGSD